jgi:hypothetical protein
MLYFCHSSRSSRRSDAVRVLPTKACELQVLTSAPRERPCVENASRHASLSCMSQSISGTPSLKPRHPPRHSWLQRSARANELVDDAICHCVLRNPSCEVDNCFTELHRSLFQVVNALRLRLFTNHSFALIPERILGAHISIFGFRHSFVIRSFELRHSPSVSLMLVMKTEPSAEERPRPDMLVILVLVL